MDTKKLLNDLKNGKITVEDAEKKLKFAPLQDLGYAVIDHQRALRNGCPEVIYCAGKTNEQIKGIVLNMLDAGTKNILGTRATKQMYDGIKEVCPDAVYHENARIILVEREPVEKTGGKILIATGGTSDIPVAEEAAITAEYLGNEVMRAYDVGVAGLHRLLSKLDLIAQADVIIAVAGMEGALASVIGGLTDKPVIAVPTSIGYGANFSGLSSLLCMLNSCANGVVVVNIDNGFGAGYTANSINKLGARRK
ncbi:MAG TPA: nickel pincer cofactor biosynthesis protein LarB [Lachnospiraceae bacterium]|nr:nickel pincer cofactor biosynthesis protein LarB [Lachnospiraceae bacterium]